MNATVRSPDSWLEPRGLQVPEAAWQGLRLRLSRGLALGEAFDESLARGVACDELSRLLEYWLFELELERQPLFRLPCFSARLSEHELCLVHARSHRSGALPLLLLHGYSGSPAEFQDLLEPLTEPSGSGAQSTPAFHVVCPALPGFGLSDGPADSRSVAEACAALMAKLGYTRYLVHGSDLGASVALELAALDGAHVAGLLVSSIPSFPSTFGEDVESLTSREKSQLAWLSEFRDQLHFRLPESPLAQLSFALSQLDEAMSATSRVDAVDALLTGLTLSCALGSQAARNQLYRDSRLRSAPVTSVPIAVHAFPLEPPSLRRFAERRHRIAEWVEHDEGGCLPALERASLLLQLLRTFSLQVL